MATSVTVKEQVLVTPSDPTPTRLLTLSSLDSQLFVRFSVGFLLLYGPSDGGATAARLKSALARALVPYYPLAGRVVTPRDRADGKLQVLCHAQGALFVEAVADHALSELEAPPKHVTQWKKMLSLHVEDVLKGDPPLVVQLTWLKDGAAALAVGINHCLADGTGSSEFLNYFADLAGGRRGSDNPNPKPVWERHLLDPKPHPLKPGSSHPEFNRVPDVSGFVTRFSNERLVPSSVTFSKESVGELKKLALSTGRPDGSGFTSFEVLTAHVWRSWARGLNLAASQELKLIFSVNVRDRVKPSLPPGYYGNAFVFGCAQTTAREMTEKGLGHVAALLRSAKQRVDDEYVRSVVESVSESRACPDSVGVLVVTQWSRLGLDRVDFGMGKPVHVGPVCSNQYCFLLPVSGQVDAVKAMVAVPETAVGKYESLLRSPYS